MAKISMRKGINISRVVAKIATTVIALYVGGVIVTELGTVMNCTASPFNKGLTLIGWTVEDNVDIILNGKCSGATFLNSTNGGVITAVSGSGILAVIGIIGIAAIVMEFVQVKM